MGKTENLLSKDDSSLVMFRAGDSIKGVVVDSNSSRILLELPGGSTGLITKRETVSYGEDEAGVFDAGAEIEATVIDPENEQGLVLLSLRRASQDTAWAELSVLQEEERTIKVKIEEANKGGLISRYKGLKAFLPVSQLMPMNYPRVEGAETGEILRKLQSHIGKEFVVKVMNVDREEGKIIISEKMSHADKVKDILKNIELGDTVKGAVSGVVKFGIFVTFEGVEGLVHVSELEWGHVSDPGKNYNVGDEIDVLIIGKENGKLSFSIKQLSEDPWLKHIEKYKEGDEVKGKIVRWNDNGVFIEVNSEVQALFSIDQFDVETGAELSAKIKEGDELEGIITSINTNSHRLELTKKAE
jgi:ribosomal protein S1